MNNWIFISDIHVKSRGDENDKILDSFLEKGKSLDVSRVFLLGDVFDLMVGGYQEYLNKYGNYFSHLRELLLVKEVFVFEGNHDFHNTDLYRSFESSLNEIQKENLNFYTEDTILENNNKRFYIGHGDVIEVENPAYQIYKKFVTSRFCYHLSQEILNYKIMSLLGEKTSERSRKRNVKRYDYSGGEEIIKQRFRKSAEIVFQKYGVDYIICGHSHIKDSYQINEKCIYLNNGYAPRSLTYLEVRESGAWSFKEIF